jgi:succinate dehydrogenase/fumarate reductase flavoprotein subunit
MQKMSEQYDVLVAGAGLAGVCAAVAAARAGARTLVIEKEPFAGGISTAALETSICN